LTIETTLDPAKQPFLYDHKIGGTAVLPGVMGLEALVEAAKVIFPDLHVAAIENVNFLSPFKFYRDQPRAVIVHANFKQENNEIIAQCRFVGSRTLYGQAGPEVTTHFTATVRLAENPAKAIKENAPVAVEGAKIDASDIYRLYFHGPAYQVIKNAWRAGEEVVGLFAENLPANHEPKDLPTVIAPRLIELCFQTAGLWEMGTKSRMGLPYQIDRVTFLRNMSGKEDSMYTVVTPDANGAFDARVVDAKGNVYLKLQGYRTMELPEKIEADLLKPLQMMMR
jgi:acyl transferase domain-containing protein